MTALNGFYDVCRNPVDAATIAKTTDYLVKRWTPEEVTAALERCIAECRYPVGLPDIVQRIQGNEVPKDDAEASAAWDELIAFAKKFVHVNFWSGKFAPETITVRRTEPDRSLSPPDVGLLGGLLLRLPSLSSRNCANSSSVAGRWSGELRIHPLRAGEKFGDARNLRLEFRQVELHGLDGAPRFELLEASGMCWMSLVDSATRNAGGSVRVRGCFPCQPRE